jgi:arylformamidase
MGTPWQHWPLAERQRQYSPSSMIASIDDELRRYRHDSMVAQLRHPPHTVAYGDHPTETIDIYLPRAQARGTLIYVHGGYWQLLSKDDSAFMVPDLLHQGWAVAVVDYELAPARAVDGIVQQCAAAARFVCDNGVLLGCSGPVVVAGSSAGGHLAGHCMVAEPRLAAAVLLSAVFDPRPLVGTDTNDALGLTDADAQALRVPADLGESRPLVVAVGEVETGEFIRQSQEFAVSARACGHPVEVLVARGRNHFDLPYDLGLPASALGAAVQRLRDSLP